MAPRTTYHQDGTVTYWSVSTQEWVRRVRPISIPEHELAAMSDDERAHLASHLASRMAALGSVSTAAKRRAAKANGKLGGRPRKHRDDCPRLTNRRKACTCQEAK